MLTELARAVETWQPVVALRTSSFLYPLVNALHIAGLGTLVGAIVTLDVRVLGLWKPQGWREAVAVVSPVAAMGLIVAVFTGILLLAVRASHYLENVALLSKTGLICLGLVNVAVFHRILARSLDERPGSLLRALSAVSLFVWVGAIFAGRWIAFVE